jgi:hypothetical protein
MNIDPYNPHLRKIRYKISPLENNRKIVNFAKICVVTTVRN